MEIEQLCEENKELWDKFALENKSAWFRHTTAWQKYSACCRFDSDTKNHSFMVKQNNEVVAIVPLLSEYVYGNKEYQEFAMYGDYTPIFAIKDNCDVSVKNIADVVNEQITLIARDNNITQGLFSVEALMDVNYQNDFAMYNLLGGENQGEILVSTTNVVDLRLDIDTILRKMRKGHKAAIKQVLKKSGYRVDIYNKDNVTKDKLLKFKEIHKIDAGRQTRTDESWDCMYEWVVSGDASLFLLWLDEINDYAAGALIMHYKKAAYYASFGTVDSGIVEGLAGYALQWEIIKNLKAIGCDVYEMGVNHIPPPPVYVKMIIVRSCWRYQNTKEDLEL